MIHFVGTCYIFERRVDVMSNKDNVIETILNTTLDEVEATVIKMRFGLDGNTPSTLSQIGKKLRVGRERVRQIEKEALVKIRGCDKEIVGRLLDG